MKKHFDIICIGGGSGGVACAVKSAKLGKSAAIIENLDLGGACVNRGCVPKKAMWHGANLMHQIIHDTKGYGIDITLNNFSWKILKQKRDQYILNIHKFYDKLLDTQKIINFNCWGSFQDEKTIITSNGDILTADHIVIAPGCKPVIPYNINGANLGVTSDDFFNLEEQPKKAIIVGAGYIAVELAGVLHNLGSDTTLIIRKDTVLRDFDTSISSGLMDAMEMDNQKIITNSNIVNIEEISENNLTITLDTGKKIKDIDCLIWAIGRNPNVEKLGLENTNIKQNSSNFITVNEYQETNISHIYAVGDITGEAQLTPVAIAAGRKLARRLFNNEDNLKVDLKNIPTVVFTHPAIGTIGLSEKDAILKYGKDDLTIYKSNFVPLYSAISGYRTATKIKLICQGENQLVIGCHIIGLGADEILQGFAVAISMKATKSDLDNTIAIHPTSAEEIVTLT